MALGIVQDAPNCRNLPHELPLAMIPGCGFIRAPFPYLPGETSTAPSLTLTLDPRPHCRANSHSTPAHPSWSRSQSTNAGWGPFSKSSRPRGFRLQTFSHLGRPRTRDAISWRRLPSLNRTHLFTQTRGTQPESTVYSIFRGLSLDCDLGRTQTRLPFPKPNALARRKP